MADIKISNLANLAAAADDDELVIVDVSAGITKKIEALDLVNTAHTHDGETLQIDGINSNGGAFPFTTSGAIALSHGQLGFPAGANPSADPNTLDDYQEGTYDMTITCVTSGSVSLNLGRDTILYEKIGRQVTIHGRFSISAIDAPLGIGRLLLPFAAIDGVEDEGVSAGSCAVKDVNFVGTWIVPDVQEGTLFFIMIGSTDNGAWTEESANIWRVGSYMDFSITYTAA